ncbi:hypothetical protein FRC11_002280 [Ceratobasidium sp. 423]|nr:hypothetical protein FRC11_002280 [Ceratobasidium sp. 423]
MPTLIHQLDRPLRQTPHTHRELPYLYPITAAAVWCTKYYSDSNGAHNNHRIDEQAVMEAAVTRTGPDIYIEAVIDLDFAIDIAQRLGQHPPALRGVPDYRLHNVAEGSGKSRWTKLPQLELGGPIAHGILIYGATADESVPTRSRLSPSSAS